MIETSMLTMEESARREAFVRRLFQAIVEGGNLVTIYLGRGGQTTGRAVIWGARLQQTVERAAHLSCCSRLDRAKVGPTQSTKQEQAQQVERNRQASRRED